LAVLGSTGQLVPRTQELNITVEENTDSDESSEEARAIGGKTLASGTTIPHLVDLTTSGENKDSDESSEEARAIGGKTMESGTTIPPLADLTTSAETTDDEDDDDDDDDEDDDKDYSETVVTEKEGIELTQIFPVVKALAMTVLLYHHWMM